MHLLVPIQNTEEFLHIVDILIFCLFDFFPLPFNIVLSFDTV